MPVPILKQGNFLIASIQTALTDGDMLQFRENLAGQVGMLGCRGVVIDVSSLDVMDSFACRTLRTTAEIIKMRGAESVIVGIQPEVAFAMVQLGLHLGNLITALDLEDGLTRLSQKLKDGSRHE